MKHNETLLYVDDNPKSRRLLTAILEQHGFTVIAAGDSLEEITRCGETRFDLALLDYKTPPLSGSELAKRIKLQHPDIPIVMICGCANVPDEDLTFVDASLGPGTALDDLVSTMHMLISGSFLPSRSCASATSWADST